MFKLDGSIKYWMYNKPLDLRKIFNGLGGIVTNGLCAGLRSGDEYSLCRGLAYMALFVPLCYGNQGYAGAYRAE